jgi:anthranilate phosphoribosyltransferase
MMFVELLEKLRRQRDLTSEEAAAAMGAMMDGEAQASQMAALLMGLRSKGERPAEIVGFARAMRARSLSLPAPVGDVFDTCGTGGDGANTFNVSTAAAIVLAGCGVRVAKHGNRAASSQCGSADVFEGLGLDLEAPPDLVIRALDTVGLGFFFARSWHPSMRHAGPTRRELGIRTAFNLLGPLTNPACPSRQIVGVSSPELTALVARALGQLGSVRAWVVHGADGLDELSTTGYSKVSEFHAGAVNTYYLHPADAGLPLASLADLRGGSMADNAGMVTRLLAGERGPRRDIVLFSAGAALLVAGRVTSLPEGVAAAAQAIDDGRAQRVLTGLLDICGKGAASRG